MSSILGVAALGISVITPLCVARAVLGASIAWLTRNTEQAAPPVASSAHGHTPTISS